MMSCTWIRTSRHWDEIDGIALPLPSQRSSVLHHWDEMGLHALDKAPIWRSFGVVFMISVVLFDHSGRTLIHYITCMFVLQTKQYLR
jgi:hypothetical protein